jgi:hypothetical protein
MSDCSVKHYAVGRVHETNGSDPGSFVECSGRHLPKGPDAGCRLLKGRPENPRYRQKLLRDDVAFGSIVTLVRSLASY